MCIMGVRWKNIPPFGGLKDLVHTLASRFWPGPLTLVLPKADIIPDIVTSGLPTVAVRVSAHPAMRGGESAGASYSCAQRQPLRPYQPYFRLCRTEGIGGSIEMILDAGACSEGLESTIVRPVLDEKGKPSLELLREGR